MPATRSSTKLATREDVGPYKPRANLRSAKASKVTSDTTKDTDNCLTADNNAATSHAATTVLPLKKGTRERCTKQQTADLEELYILTEGYPTVQQIEQIAEDIGK
jgi:hypothetical protein